MSAVRATLLVAGVLLALPVLAIVATVSLISGTEQAACAGITDTTGTTTGGGGGGWVATAYGPPWDAENGTGVTATGLDLTAGQPAYEIAVDPTVIPLESFEHVTPNPFGTTSAFYAGDTGGAILGRHVDIYDWQGRASQDAWGVRHVTVTPAPDPGTGSLIDDITPTADSATVAGLPADDCPVSYAMALPLTTGPLARILSSGLAAAPAGAPSAVKLAIAAGNQLIDLPYLYGGGHGQPLTVLASAYDCSSSTSYILYGAGVFAAWPQDSTQLESYRDPGPGRWITVYANSAHAFISVAGVVMDTAWYAPVAPSSPSSGPRWQPQSIIATQYAGDTAAGNGGFVQRHPQGL